MADGQADFFRSLLPYARRVSELTGIDPRLVLAQSAIETGYGRSAPNYNFFGIKAPQGQGASLLTSEFENGQMVSRNEPFRTYSSPAESFDDYANLMLSASRYQPVREAQTLEDQIAAMAASGYATDPNYGNLLTQVASRVNLDDPSLIASDAMNAIGRGPDTAGMTATGRPRAETMNQPMQPQPMPQQEQPRGLRGLLSNPDFLDQLSIGFGGMTLNPNTALMQMAADRISGRREERQTTEAQNRTAEWLRSQNRDDLADAVMSGAISGRDAATIAYQQPEERGQVLTAEQMREMFPGAQIEDGLYNLKPDGTATKVGGGGITNILPGAPTIGPIPPGYQAVQDPETGRYTFEPIEGGPAAAEAATLAEQRAAQADTAASSIALIDSVIKDPSLGSITGQWQGRIPALTQSGTDLVIKIEQLQGQAFLQAFESLKGGGAITEREGLAAQNAIARLNRAQGTEAFTQALRDLRDIVDRGRRRALGEDVPEMGTGIVVGEPY